MINNYNLGWMAGVIDVRGRLIRKNNQTRLTEGSTPQVVLAVRSKEVFIIRRLAELTGTKPDMQAARKFQKEWLRRGCNEHCPEAHVHVPYEHEGLPPTALWTVTGSAMVIVLHNLIPYLSSDEIRGYTEAYQEVLESTPQTGRGVPAILKSMNRLHHLGWELPEKYRNMLHLDDEEEKEEVDALSA